LLINGTTDDLIPISDRGLQYGDGLFETMAVIQGKPCQWHRHMARLSRGEEMLGFPPSDKLQIKQAAFSLCSGHSQAVLKIILTRGSGGRGYAPPNPCSPRHFLTLHPWPDYPRAWYAKGIDIKTGRTRIGRNSQLAGYKHLNRLEQVLARKECQDRSLVECLMMDEEDRVICGAQSNLFMFQGDTLYTPDLTHSGIAGIVRELVIECAGQLSIPLVITDLNRDRLMNADAIFITNSLIGFCPVASLNRQPFDLDKIPVELRHRVEVACREG
jgi:4-amino-4-deoxychorismate lyase